MNSHYSATPGDVPEPAPSAAPAPPALVEALDSPEAIAAEVSTQLEAFTATLAETG